MRGRLRLWLDRLGSKPALVVMFLICAFPTGVMLAVLTPPGQVPDETAHLVRAAGLLQGEILAHRRFDPDTLPPLRTGVMVDQGLVSAVGGVVTMNGVVPKVAANDYLRMRTLPPNHTLVFASIPNTAAYFPAVYLPSALGLALGLAINASPYECFEMARLGMLLAFLALGSAAIWITAFGEALLMGALLLPMTLFLAGSASEDGVVIGLSCFAAAALTRRAPADWRFRFFGIAALMLVLGVKSPYIPLLGTALLPLYSVGIRRRFGLILCSLLPVLAWGLILARFVLVPFRRPAYHPGPLWGGPKDVTLQSSGFVENFHILIAHPVLFVVIPWRSILNYGIEPLREMIGVLGRLQLLLPDGFYQAWCLALLAAFLGSIFTPRNVEIPGSLFGEWMDVGFATAIIILAYWATMIASYLYFTGVGATLVEGMQGRYSIPLFAFLIFAVPPCRGRPILPRVLPALPILALGFYDIGFLPMRLTEFFYMN